MENSSSPKNKDGAALNLDDGQTRSEVDVNLISKSAGILKAETMYEQALEDHGDEK